MHIRVTMVAHGQPGVRAVSIRTVLRIVDVMPTLYLIGFLIMRRRDPPQRIGDILAGTTVQRLPADPPGQPTPI